MQVFKSYFKIFNKYKGQMIMYLGIFTALLSGFVINNAGSDVEYVNANCSFAVYDYDNSEESRELVSFLSEKHERVDIKADDSEVIQDELFNRNIHCLLRIPEGFSDAIKEGDWENVLKIVTIPGTKYNALFESDLDRFVNYASIYVKSGYSSEEAVKKAVNVLSQTSEVSLLEGEDLSSHSNSYYFFNYLGWVLMCMVITAITPTLAVYNRKELRKRISCSAYPFSKINIELFLGVAVMGVGICGILLLLAQFIIGGEIWSVHGAFYMLNTLCYMFVALAVAFLVSRLTNSEQIISMVANVVSLGMAFLCGIFVPMEYLGENVIKFAHFLPAYWFAKATQWIEHMQEHEIGTLLRYMGVEVLFAAAIWFVALAVAKGKKA